VNEITGRKREGTQNRPQLSSLEGRKELILAIVGERKQRGEREINGGCEWVTEAGRCRFEGGPPRGGSLDGLR